MNSRIVKLQSEFPDQTLHIIGDNVLISCFEKLRIQEEIRWPILIVCIQNNCQYIMKLADENSIEPLIYEQIDDSDLSPKMVGINKCQIYNLFDNSLKYYTAFVIEKYEGDLSSLLEIVTDELLVRGIIIKIINKSLDLNINHRIRHGDFHPGNIVYRGDDLRFIDFELSTIYDESYQPIKSGVSIIDLNYYAYNVYHDLLTLEWNIPYWNVQFIVPQEYRDHYLSTLNEKDLELMNEVKDENDQYPKLTFNL